MVRYAIVRNARTRQEAEAFLPDNYKVIYEIATRDDWKSTAESEVLRNDFVIAGEDSHGWTLDGYVVPRYASGVIACEEIDLSHPVMKEVPSGLVG